MDSVALTTLEQQRIKLVQKLEAYELRLDRVSGARVKDVAMIRQLSEAIARTRCLVDMLDQHLQKDQSAAGSKEGKKVS